MARAIENQLYVAAANRVGLGFDGKTYFTSIYGGFFKLRDYAVSDPDFVLSILNKYKKKGVFDGEVAETLSNVIDEVELIAKASR